MAPSIDGGDRVSVNTVCTEDSLQSVHVYVVVNAV